MKFVAWAKIVCKQNFFAVYSIFPWYLMFSFDESFTDSPPQYLAHNKLFFSNLVAKLDCWLLEFSPNLTNIVLFKNIQFWTTKYLAFFYWVHSRAFGAVEIFSKTLRVGDRPLSQIAKTQRLSQIDLNNSVSHLNSDLPIGMHVHLSQPIKHWCVLTATLLCKGYLGKIGSCLCAMHHFWFRAATC